MEGCIGQNKLVKLQIKDIQLRDLNVHQEWSRGRICGLQSERSKSFFNVRNINKITQSEKEHFLLKSKIKNVNETSQQLSLSNLQVELLMLVRFYEFSIGAVREERI